jgi:hypothetical protein
MLMVYQGVNGGLLLRCNKMAPFFKRPQIDEGK